MNKLIQIEELKQQILQIQPKIHKLKEAINFDEIVEEVKNLEGKTIDPDFWNNTADSQSILQKIKFLKSKIESYNNVIEKYEDVSTMIDISIEEQNEDMADEIKMEYEELVKLVDLVNLSTLLSGEYDKNNAILTLHSGAGGTEAQDWVEMLYRMYVRWAEKHGYKTKILDYLDGEEAGIKSVSVLMDGMNAYGFLKSEAGVHRLVRISPFDSSGRRHTSFASVEVMPEINDELEIKIDDKDLKIDTYRAGGAGGQHVNKTESAVRITHIPTGVVVACQNERSQHQNKEVAMIMLKSKLIEIKEREHLERIEDIKGNQKEIGWGSQIRSYVFMPYTLVKDHRTGYENGNISSVMDGEIDGFINSYLINMSKQNISENIK